MRIQATEPLYIPCRRILRTYNGPFGWNFTAGRYNTRGTGSEEWSEDQDNGRAGNWIYRPEPRSWYRDVRLWTGVLFCESWHVWPRLQVCSLLHGLFTVAPERTDLGNYPRDGRATMRESSIRQGRAPCGKLVSRRHNRDYPMEQTVNFYPARFLRRPDFDCWCQSPFRWRWYTYQRSVPLYLVCERQSTGTGEYHCRIRFSEIWSGKPLGSRIWWKCRPGGNTAYSHAWTGENSVRI